MREEVLKKSVCVWRGRDDLVGVFLAQPKIKDLISDKGAESCVLKRE